MDAQDLAQELKGSWSREYGSADDFFHLPTVEFREVEAGGRLWRVRGLSAGERDSYEASMLKGQGANQSVDMSHARAKLIALGTVDATGQRIFKDTDVARISRKPAAVLEPLFQAIRDLSGMSDADIAELTGNSSGPDDDSSSLSPDI